MRNIDVTLGFEVRFARSLRGAPFGRVGRLESDFRRLRGVSLGLVSLAALVFGSACTLITDVDREKIPVSERPPFPEIDAGRAPDASSPGGQPSEGDAAAPETQDAATATPPGDEAGGETDAGGLDAG